MGFKPSIFIAANKSYHIKKQFNENQNHSECHRIDFNKYFLYLFAVACLMHFAQGDIFPLNGKGQLGFIISLIVSLTNTNTNTNTNSIKLVLCIKLNYINIPIKY